MSKGLRHYKGFEKIEAINRRLHQFDSIESGGLGYMSAVEAAEKEKNKARRPK